MTVKFLEKSCYYEEQCLTNITIDSTARRGNPQHIGHVPHLEIKDFGPPTRGGHRTYPNCKKFTKQHD